MFLLNLALAGLLAALGRTSALSYLPPHMVTPRRHGDTFSPRQFILLAPVRLNRLLTATHPSPWSFIWDNPAAATFKGTKLRGVIPMRFDSVTLWKTAPYIMGYKSAEGSARDMGSQRQSSSKERHVKYVKDLDVYSAKHEAARHRDTCHDPRCIASPRHLHLIPKLG
uniref:Uncharacterized protein n=1 Tax=Branchiostoma floridae TaxID=7739 RepID=C3Y7K8_BRAFL|eukprot:XP_002607826.1 hypothetical protein BRAFLDRAFT_64091 [Branchiostoma floridae]